MAPLSSIAIAKRTLVAAGPEMARLAARDLVVRRGLSVNSTQKVTLGVIVAYVVGIALLWNLPYVRWSLWPFKVGIYYSHCLLPLSSYPATHLLSRNTI
jgi:hypothetical protein